ncbi:MAG: NAD(P)H-dependent oxidoreductase [Candidatus Taylorbacteria bacterium]|nr:NAD(P)H-dependent oxidoreductase [Candidatus Taylorbacteria bacterium]
MSHIQKALEWRYATKQFDSTKKLTEEQLNTILESMRLSASSYGLQPWKFVIVQNPEVREKLKAASWNQPQVTDASHFVVLCVRTDVNEAYVDAYMKKISETRSVPVEQLSGYADMIKGTLGRRTAEQILEWSTHQVYIALGTALLAAAETNIDACPMEGFESSTFDTILDLPAKNLSSRVCIALGFRAESDEMAKAPKVRFDSSDVVIEIA